MPDATRHHLFDFPPADGAIITIAGLGDWGGAPLDALPGDMTTMARLVAAHSGIAELAASAVRTLVLLDEVADATTTGNDAGPASDLRCSAAPGPMAPSDSGLTRLCQALAGSDVVLLLGDPAEPVVASVLPGLVHWCLAQGMLTRVIMPAQSQPQPQLPPQPPSLPPLPVRPDGVGVAIELAPQDPAAIPALLRHLCYGLCGILQKSSPIGVDFADLRAVLEETGTSVAALGRARGAGRAWQAGAAALVEYPALQGQLESARAVMALILSRDWVGLDEFSTVGEWLHQYLDDTATVVIGMVAAPGLDAADLELLLVVTSADDAAA